MPIFNKIRASPYRRCLRFVGSFFIEQIDRVLRFFLDKDLRSSCSNDMSVEPQRFFWGLKKVGIFSFILRDKFVTS